MITFSHLSTFKDQYLASLTVQFKSKPLFLMNLIFPLAGLFLLLVILLGINKQPSFFELLIIPLAFGFTPIITALSVYLARRKNKTIGSIQQFTFDEEGIEISNSSFNTRLKWDALYRATETRKFFLFYISPRMAYYLPKSVAENNKRIQELRELLVNQLLCPNNIKP